MNFKVLALILLVSASVVGVFAVLTSRLQDNKSGSGATSQPSQPPAPSSSEKAPSTDKSVSSPPGGSQSSEMATKREFIGFCAGYLSFLADQSKKLASSPGTAEALEREAAWYRRKARDVGLSSDKRASTFAIGLNRFGEDIRANGWIAGLVEAQKTAIACADTAMEVVPESRRCFTPALGGYMFAC